MFYFLIKNFIITAHHFHNYKFLLVQYSICFFCVSLSNWFMLWIEECVEWTWVLRQTNQPTVSVYLWPSVTELLEGIVASQLNHLLAWAGLLAYESKITVATQRP